MRYAAPFAAIGMIASTLAVVATPETVSNVISFDLSANQLPEGLAVRDAETFVGMAIAQKVVRLSSNGEETFATYPTLPEGKGFLTGLSFAPDGALWAGLASFDPSVTTGIYTVDGEGGDASLHATIEGMAFPNDLAWMSDGSALVSDSIAGVIWRVTAEGNTTQWLKDDLLKGAPLVCAPDEVGFGIGANGLDFGPDGALYIAVTDRAQVLRVEVENGDAGAVTPVNETNCELLEGVDGINAGPEGIIAAVNRTNQLSLISYDGEVSSLSRSELLDFPASIVAQDDGFLITNFGLISAGSGKAQVGLVRLK